MGKLAVNKVINYIENNIHLDASCNDYDYRSNMHYMETAEEICDYIERVSPANDATLKFLEVVSEITTNKNELVDSVNQYGDSKIADSAIRKRAEKKLGLRLSEFYETLGKTFDETKIIDSLVKRNNKFFQENDLDYMKTNRDTALKEFARTDPSTTVMFGKITFWINKLTKYITYVEYYNNYKKDSNNGKTHNENRIKYVSKLKTDFLKEVFNLTKEQSKGVTYRETLENISEQYQGTYQKLFGDTIDKLNLKDDLDDVLFCSLLREKLYSLKSLMSTYCIASLLTEYEKGKLPRSVNNWGFAKDNNGKYVLNMNINNYPLPISTHITDLQLSVIIEQMKGFGKTLMSSKVEFPEYISLRTNSGNIVPTNILFVPTIQQREKIEEDAKLHPKNRLVQALDRQVNKKIVDIKKQNIIEISQQDLSPEL